MKTVNLVLATHNHQPIGNFEKVFHRAFERAYKPFLDVLEQYPPVKMSLHYSGILLEWLQRNHPSTVRQIRNMVKQGQVEIIGGTYFEAILSAIPDADKAGQIAKLNKAIKKAFGVRPAGMWLAERVWESHLAGCIADAGLRYFVIDDTHFKYAGHKEQELQGYYITEEQGKTLSVFPIAKILRYTMPFQPVQKTIEYLQSVATEDGNRIVVFADDGEKFGIWPKTFDHVYTNGWLREFFEVITQNKEWIHLKTFSEILGTLSPSGRTYLPNASYSEMMHWALPVHHFRAYEELERMLEEQQLMEKYESFFKGGFWRNFFVKYPEANTMHKKMMRVSNRARRLMRSQKAKVSERTLEKIWAAQCNDPYWHGVFGGLYLPVLRYPIYHNLIAAEADMDRIERKKNVTIETTDFDCDGLPELIVETPSLNCYMKPDLGGSIFELDFKPISVNLLDIVSRREEGYHYKLADAIKEGTETVASIHDIVVAKEEGLGAHLNYDWYRHGSLIDHFFGRGTTVDDVWRCRYPEEGDFVNQPYTFSSKKKGQVSTVELRRSGRIWRDTGGHQIEIRKQISFSPRGNDVSIEYSILNKEQDAIDLWFGSEFNVGLQAGNASDRYYYALDSDVDEPRLGSKGEILQCGMLGLRDEWLGVDVQIETGTPTTFWRFPIETVSLSESGFERIFQSSVVIPHWNIHLEKEWHCTIIQRIGRLNHKGLSR